MFAKTLPFSSRCIAAVCTATLLVSSPAIAQEADQSGFVDDVGGSERINLSGKLRMLSQRIPAAACNLHAGILPDESRAVMIGAVAEFDQILAALEFGDETLGVNGAEGRRKTLVAIEEVHRLFDPLEVALGDMANDVPSDAALQTLADENLNVLEATKDLVFEISAQYSNPAEVLQIDAATIDIAGRQRLLTQEASKDVCFIMSGFNVDESMEELASTVTFFEASLGALRDGMDAAGVRPPPTPEIAEGLVEVNTDWSAVKASLDAVMAGETVSDDVRADVFIGLNKTMADMNRVVGLYSEASKLGL